MDADAALRRSWTGRVFIGMSLDGYIARTDGDLGWLTDPPARDHVGSGSEHPAVVWETFFPDIDTIVMGRHTFETVADFEEWPFPDTRVIVLSSSLRSAAHAEVAPSLTEAERLLHRYGARQVYIDGGKTIRTFLSAGFVDEITVSVAPVLLGDGTPLFGAVADDVLLTLRGAHSTSADGLVRITYSVEQAPPRR